MGRLYFNAVRDILVENWDWLGTIRGLHLLEIVASITIVTTVRPEGYIPLSMTKSRQALLIALVY